MWMGVFPAWFESNDNNTEPFFLFFLAQQIVFFYKTHVIFGLFGVCKRKDFRILVSIVVY